MNKQVLHPLTLAIALAGLCSSAGAELPPKPTKLYATQRVKLDAVQANRSTTLRFATGAPGKGYSRLFANIQSVCGNQLKMAEVHTEGGLQNLTVLAANQADVGFAQIDTLDFLKDSDDNIAALRAVIPTNANLLHIVASEKPFEVPGKKLLGISFTTDEVTIKALPDLKGLPVAVVGSARSVGRELNRLYDLEMDFRDVNTDQEGFDLVMSGKVDRKSVV